MKKVAGKRLFCMEGEALAALAHEVSRTGKNQSRIINDLLLGRDRFLPAVERMIAVEMERTGHDRRDAIEMLLWRSLTDAGTSSAAEAAAAGGINADVKLVKPAAEAAAPSVRKSKRGRGSR